MSDYAAPVNDLRFVLNHVVDLAGLATLPGYEQAEPDVVDQILEQAARFASGVLAPLNQPGDTQGCVLENGVVRTPTGFADAYAQFREIGWNGVQFDPEFGGGGMPWVVATALGEMWNAANMSFSLCTLLNQGAVEAISAHGTEAQKRTYLEAMIAGRWSGTMNLTEPQAGSDVGALTTRAEPRGDGTWSITGQKIFITYGEHDFTDNIIHLVLARTPGAPAGTRGISLFIVPKFLVNEDGSLGQRNDLACVSLEHKLGIHASPTCVMSFGDDGACIGTMLGQENKGMRCMFTMMNNARLAVGVQGVAIADRAYQRAARFALERRQGKPLRPGTTDGDTIIEHADVRRMLMTMRAYVEAMRAVVLLNAEAIDLGLKAPDQARRTRMQSMAELLTPISKAWCTDMGCELASIGVQVHGGMGFIEETGAAQHMRDARIAPIYEGTNGIQALDLVMRKLPLDGGAVVRGVIDDMADLEADLNGETDAAFAAMAAAMRAALAALKPSTDWMLERLASDPNEAAAGAAPYLRMFGVTLGGSAMARAALAAQGQLRAGTGADPDFLRAKIATARFYAEQIMPQVAALRGLATAGSSTLYALSADQLVA